MDKRLVVALALAGVAAAGYIAYRYAFRAQVPDPRTLGRRPPPPPPPPGPASLHGAPGSGSYAGTDGGGQSIGDYVDEGARYGGKEGLESVGVPAPLAEYGSDKAVDAAEWVGGKIADIF